MHPREDEPYMRQALECARKAAESGEVPVGAVIVQKGQIVGMGWNRREELQNALAHAEIAAIHDACTRLKTWRLSGCELYVTLEPCPMCAGAIGNARLRRVVYGASDPIAGCCGSAVNLFEMGLTAATVLRGGILEKECRALLETFFSSLRTNGVTNGL